jgi:hypothetical protein
MLRHVAYNSHKSVAVRSSSYLWSANQSATCSHILLSSPDGTFLYRDVTTSTTSKTVVPYDGVPTKRLLRAFLVFQLCSYDWLVNRQTALLKIFRRLVGRKFFAASMRATIFGQFIAGEKDEEIVATAKWLASRNVIPMFAYTATEMPSAVSE